MIPGNCGDDTLGQVQVADLLEAAGATDAATVHDLIETFLVGEEA